jgi:hypothetical protein
MNDPVETAIADAMALYKRVKQATKRALGPGVNRVLAAWERQLVPPQYHTHQPKAPTMPEEL